MAQAISLAVSCITNLILPKVIGEVDFSYWQLFVFYTSYIPCLALGLNDGVYLRYGGQSKDSVDFTPIKSQYIVGIIFQTLEAVIVAIIFLPFFSDANRQFVVLASVTYYIFYTCHNFLGYLFQAFNETNVYSSSIILNKAVYLIGQVTLLLIGTTGSRPFIIFYTIAFAFAFFYLFIHIRPYFKNARFEVKLGIHEASISMRVGISLMISNICSMLVLGIGRQVIDFKWGIEAFGKVSFSLSLMNFALTFISQIGMVLFPALRQLEQNELSSMYKKLSGTLFKLLPFIYILYFPCSWVLGRWLPAYVDSIRYLEIVLPICFFDCKMNLIGNTFFKVLNKQVQLLKINLITIVFCAIFSITGAFAFDNMMLIIVGMVFAVILRSILADIILRSHIKVDLKKYDFWDLVLAILFMIAAHILPDLQAMLVMILAVIVRYLFVLRKDDKNY